MERYSGLYSPGVSSTTNSDSSSSWSTFRENSTSTRFGALLGV